MNPEKAGLKAKKDEDVIRCIEAWKTEIEELRRVEPDRTAELHDDYKIVALKSILPDGEIKKIVELREHEWEGAGGYKRIEDEVIRWALKKRGDSLKTIYPGMAKEVKGHEHKSPMEVDQVIDQGVEPEAEWHWDQGINNWAVWSPPIDECHQGQAGECEVDIDAVGKGKGLPPKGKGKGKGKFQSMQSTPNWQQPKGGKKGYGKSRTTPFTGNCNYCRLPGHPQAECPYLGKGFSGRCNICQTIGHMARACPKGKAQGKGISSVEPEAEQTVGGLEWQLCAVDHDENDEHKCCGEIGAVEDDWEYVKMTIDSGSVDTVGPPTIAADVPVKPTEASKAGRDYRAANGTKIKNLGAKSIKAMTDDGNSIGIEMQVAENITKLLASVSKITKANNSVLFHPPGWDSCIYNWDNGKTTKIVEENGVYHIGLWIRKSNVAAVKKATEPGFTRQGSDE